MKKKPVKVQATVRVRAYPLIADAVEHALVYGWNRAHKHTSTPSEEAIMEALEQAVMNALCEVLDFGEH